MGLLSVLLYIVFVFAAIVLIVVILLQEGRGGGFGQALGEHGQATFGVGAKGINRFTAWMAAVFLLSAVGIHVLTRQSEGASILDRDPSLQGVGAGEAPGGAPAPIELPK